jgi:lysyl-tRNA synthetase class 1
MINTPDTLKAWPFEEAKKLLKRFEKNSPAKGYALFETGYSPSGLPHIGTFGEVFRTTLVRHAFEQLSDIPTKLIAFSDDMDGLRKVPTNLPNQELLAENLHKPLTKVPDPFGTHESFAANNNARLRAFLDDFGFAYDFQSSTDSYQSGAFDGVLISILQNYDAIIKVILPTLGKERQATYSPFLPICPRTGHVLQVPIIERNLESNTVVYVDDTTGEKVEVPVTGGHCKLQWKIDWPARWVALGVDYEMAGKDHLETVSLSGKICRILGAQPPESLSYELFLDDKGEKISKSKGNGLSLEEWLTYAPQESLSLYMFQAPRRAKRLHFDVIPKATDEYLAFLTAYQGQSAQERYENPVWHIHQGNPPLAETSLTFSLLLNLATACNASDKSVLWGFIQRYDAAVSPENAPFLDALAGYAVRYYHDFVLPAKAYRAPTEKERAALQDLQAKLKTLDAALDAEAIQTEIYTIGTTHQFENLRDWFKALYEVLLGQSQGPRFGSFVKLYGLNETATMIEEALAR